MSEINTRALPGFMELLPEEQLEFNRIKQIISTEYQKFGFTPLDTPVIERSETLLAKAGGETEKQIYRFKKGDNDLSLRFDLTVPLARYVAQHFSDLTFPFKRCHIDKVYRGESPQKGRFREFYQCDIDVIGHNELSLNYDAEIPGVIYSIFSKLNFGKFTIKVNNRKVLTGVMEHLELSDITADVLRIIDKIDKISRDEFIAELEKINLNKSQIDSLMNFIGIRGNSVDVIKALRDLNITNQTFNIGVDELEKVTDLMKLMGISEDYFVIDLSIARGLDYYTGTIYETNLDEYPKIGSVCSGGRYDDLASFYTKEKLPGVGISIGLTRLFYQLNEAGIITNNQKTVANILVMPLTDSQIKTSIEVVKSIRESGVDADILLQEMSMKKKFKYADKKGIKYVVVIGEEEAKSGILTVQSMITGDKSKIAINEISLYFCNNH
jgi:histidyl-tRNA synthetase